MKYFSVPTCPYCKKRVNLIRTWSLKRQGEYRCPRCGGISNIYLSPLIYAFALMAVLAAGALYFFHKFVLDDVSLGTVIQVVVPFALFFLLALFMVYLEKPVIKKVSKADIDRRRRAEERRQARKKGGYTGGRPAAGERSSRPDPREQQMFYEEDEYLPKVDYRTGPLPASVQPQAARTELDSTSVMPVAHEAAPHRSMTLEQVTAPTKVAPPDPAKAGVHTAPAHPAESLPVHPVTDTSGVFEIVTPGAEKPAGPAEDDFFAKYEDPAYVERRLQELKRQRGGE